MNKKAELLWAEAYYLMSLTEGQIPEHLIAEGTYERYMWMKLFRWAGWMDD